MVLFILAISIAVFITALIIHNGKRYDEFWCGISIFAGFASLSAMIAVIVVGVEVSKFSVIDERIAMYQEENAVIEQQIVDIVEQYQKYETDIFMEVAPESAVSMVALYPELKSDSLVQAQIEVYVKNNNMIKGLKDQQIKGDVYRWWLYFGGGRD